MNHNMSVYVRRLRATRTRLLLGLLAIGAFASAGGQARGQQGLHVVPSPFINNSSLSATAAIADNDIWAVGQIAGSNSSGVTLAEHFTRNFSVFLDDVVAEPRSNLVDLLN